MKRIPLLALLVLTSCEQPNSTSENQVTASPSPVSAWNYRIYDDAMRKKRTWIANITASNPAQLEFPYFGGTSATIELVQGHYDHPENQQPMLILSNGQLDCSTECYLSVKFDDSEVFDSVGTKTNCGEDQCVNLNIRQDIDTFGTPASFGFHKRMARSKKMIIETPIYGFGTHQFEFSTAGLVWPQPGAPTSGEGTGIRDGSKKKAQFQGAN